MFILMGEQTKEKLHDDGQFTCPSCAQTRHYQHIQHKTYFTLFFLPLLPMGISANYVVCQTCEDSFHPSILDDETQSHRAVYHYSCIRVMLAVLDQADSRDIAAFCDTFETISKQTLSTDDAYEAIREARRDNLDILIYLQRSNMGLNIKGRTQTLSAAVILMAKLHGLQFEHAKQVLLNQIATTLELPSKLTQEILHTLDNKSVA